MNNTLNLGRFFVCLASQGQGASLVNRAITVEKVAPFRRGDSLMIRPPFIKHRPVTGLVVGIWRKPTVGTPVGPEMGA